MTLGDIVRNRRIELNMTQEDLAKAVGTTKATVSRWESGDIHKMKRSMIAAVSVALHLDPLLFFQQEEVLMPDEYRIITAYRAADDGTKSAVRKLLDVPEAKKDTLSSVG
jgi:transcriptional regulator with XRE-family HTH domain